MNAQSSLTVSIDSMIGGPLPILLHELNLAVILS